MLNFFLDDFQKKAQSLAAFTWILENSQNVWLKCVRAPASARTSLNKVKT